MVNVGFAKMRFRQWADAMVEEYGKEETRAIILEALDRMPGRSARAADWYAMLLIVTMERHPDRAMSGRIS